MRTITSVGEAACVEGSILLAELKQADSAIREAESVLGSLSNESPTRAMAWFLGPTIRSDAVRSVLNRAKVEELAKSKVSGERLRVLTSILEDVDRALLESRACDDGVVGTCLLALRMQALSQLKDTITGLRMSLTAEVLRSSTGDNRERMDG